MRLGVVLLLIVVGLLSGCRGAPESFQPFEGSGAQGEAWSAIEIRDDVSYEDAWGSVSDLVVKAGFDLEMIERNSGYLRTAWNYTWTGKRRKNYRVRLVVKFAANRKRVDVKSEAEYGGNDADDEAGSGKTGWDRKLLETVKRDIMGVVGRATR